MWSGKPASDYDMLKVFGGSSYYHMNDEKLKPQGKKVMFLGFKGSVKG